MQACELLFSLSTECMEAAQKKSDGCCTASQSLHILFQQRKYHNHSKVQRKTSSWRCEKLELFLLYKPVTSEETSAVCLHAAASTTALTWHPLPHTCNFNKLLLLTCRQQRSISCRQSNNLQPKCNESARANWHVHIDTPRCRPPRALHVNI